MAHEKQLKPSVFRYENFRTYLVDMITYYKSQRAAFSYRSLSKSCGMSHTLIKLVIKGERSLTREAAQKLCIGLKLTKEESTFFMNLALFNQSETTEKKNLYFEKMSRSQRYKDIRLLESEQYEYFSKWYYSAVRELVALSFFKEDPEWIARTLSPSITPKQAEQAIVLLMHLGLLKRNDQGQLILSDNSITSGAEIKSLAAMNYHKEALKRSAEALETIPFTERDISSVIISARTDNIQAIKHEIQTFRKKILILGEHKVADHDRIYQLNLQLYPITHQIKKEPE